MNILDIFYKEIIQEAKNGVVSNYFAYNILFETFIEEERKYIKSDKLYDGIIIPVLSINNKEVFNNLLVEYVNRALAFYNGSQYLEEIIANDKFATLEKTIMTLLWSNATFEDFANPIAFLQKRIAFFNSELETIIEYKNVPLFNGDLIIEVKKDKIFNETPYKMNISLINEANERFIFPEIKFGIQDNTVYIYAIQNVSGENNSYAKKINRTLYKIGEGFDSEKDYKVAGLNNLKDITASFLVAINIAISYFNSLGYKSIVVPSILITRWNAKRIAYERSKINNFISKENYDLLVQKQFKIQENLTDKLLRTFYRLIYHYKGIEVDFYPFDIDSCLHISISDKPICNNELLNITWNVVDKDIFNKSI